MFAGTTEAPGISTNGKLGVGVDVQLKPDDQYNNDNQTSNKTVGEILVKTRTMSPGYFKNPSKTNESYENGFFCTGDIGEFDENGNLHVIDRKKNILEIYLDGRSVWIPSGKVESVLAKCSCVKQIFIHGERTQHSLVAVVVPHWPFIVNTLSSLQLLKDNHDTKEVILASQHSEVLEAAILAEFENVGKSSGLKSHEIPKGVVIEVDDTWTVHNGLLTATQKNTRNKLLAKYRLAIDIKYAQLNSQGH